MLRSVFIFSLALCKAFSVCVCVRCILQSCSLSIFYCIGVGQYKCFAYSVNLTENSILSASQACFSSSHRCWCRWSFLFVFVFTLFSPLIYDILKLFLFSLCHLLCSFFSFLIYNSETKKNGQLLSMYWILFSFVTLISLDNSRACKKRRKLPTSH